MLGKWIVEAGQRAGKNEASIEMFKKGGNGAIAALIREDIQNSLDAVKDKSKPVIVNLKTSVVNELPGQIELNNIYNQIKDSSSWGHAYDKDIDNIQNILNKSDIPVLKVSDFNTKGAEGASSYNKFGNSNWIALTEINGQTKKDNASSAGSFGIGKNANMAITPLRTIFFTSKVDSDPIAYSQGKMTYASIVDPKNNLTTGNSYFYKDSVAESMDNSTEVILEDGKSKPIKGELKEFQDLGKRMNSGTDIFIPGIDLKDTSYENIRDAVLDNFLVSVHKGILEVNIDLMNEKKQTICKDTLKNVVNDSENIKFKNYYAALTQKEPKYIFEMEKVTNKNGELISDKGDVKFLVFQSDDIKGTRKAMLTRGIGMKICNYPERGRLFPQGIDFTAVLLVTGDIPNELLHKIENPEHTSWNNKDKFKEAPDAKILFNSLKTFMKESVTKLLPETTDDIAAYGIDEMLSDDKFDVEKDDKLPTTISKIRIKKTLKPTTRKSANGISGHEGPKQGVPASNNENQSRSLKNNGNGQQRNSKDSGGKGSDTIDVTPYIESLRSRKMENDYVISLKSKEIINNPTLVFEIVGDSSTDTKFEISDVRFNNKDYEIKVENNVVELLGTQDVFNSDETINFSFKTNAESAAAFNVKVLGKRNKSDEN